MKNKNVAFMTQAAMIAAIYVVLTYVFAPFSFGEVQIRIAEALTILPVFTPAAIPGLFVGCIVGNILGGAILPDIIFGSIATLIGAFFTYQLRNKNRFLAPLPPIIANTVIVSLRIWSSTSDSVYDVDSWCRRSCRMWCAWISPLYCIESL